MIELTKGQFEEILNYALDNLPNEVCGLLGGVIENGTKRVKKIYALVNTDQSPEHFSMDPKEQFQVIKDIRSNGWQLLGNFHSHPSSPSRPSDEDKKLAYDSVLSYLILSLLDRQKPIIKSFKICNNDSEEEEIKIVED